MSVLIGCPIFIKKKKKKKRKKEIKNIKVDILELLFTLNYQGTKVSTTHFKLSDASFQLLKKLSRIYPTSPEIACQRIAIESYSIQQKYNIYRSLTVKIDLITLLKSFKGIVLLFIHKNAEFEMLYDKASSIYGIIWIAPWAMEAIIKFQYMELDATFELTKPYFLLCPQIITNGLSLPLGFILRPSENWTLFDVFYDELIKIK